MNLLDHAIGFEDEQIFPARRFNYRAIVTDQTARIWQLANQRSQERIFTDSTQFHC